jgi:hypothetical protein
MTQTLSTMYTILDSEFDVDQLKDIVTHGMSGGVGGFIYTASNVAIFDDNDDEIQDYLSDWCHDNGVGASSFAYFGKDIEDIAQLKSALVWAYVELKADEILAHNGYEY